jgi:uncharacterized protein (DUF2147 family)
MKSFYLNLTAAAALLLASTAAQAGSNGISFQVGDHKVHVEQPRGCNALSCLQITAPGLSAKSINLNNINLNGFKSKSSDDDDVATSTPAPSAPQPVPAPAAAPAPQAPAAVATTTQPAPPAPVAQPAPAPAPVAAYAPANPAPVTAPAPTTQAPQVAAAAPAPQAAPVAAQPAPTTPLGVWATEENKGNVRIEQCGQNLCGYADKSNERILINMKPVDGNKWTGRIHDPDGGGNYDSTMAMKGPNVLKVQGCAFGGMFCGGQTWKRIS